MLKKIVVILLIITCVGFTSIQAIDLSGSTQEAQEQLEAIEIEKALSETIDKNGIEDIRNTMVVKLNSQVAYVNNTRSVLASRSSGFIRDDGRAMLPLRTLTDAMNTTIEYDVETNKAIIKNEGTIVTIYIDSEARVLKNGVIVEEALAMQYIDDKLYVSVRQLADIMGMSIDYQQREDGEYIVIVKNESANQKVVTPRTIQTIDVVNTYHGLIMPCTGIDKSYLADSGIDIHCPIGTPVYALADCYINYSEYGHTRWTGPNDTAYSIMITFDKPIVYNGITLKRAFYTHLSALVYSGNPGRMIHQGELLGYTGIANNAPHLHFELLEMDTMSELTTFYGTQFGKEWVAGQ